MDTEEAKEEETSLRTRVGLKKPLWAKGQLSVELGSSCYKGNTRMDQSRPGKAAPSDEWSACSGVVTPRYVQVSWGERTKAGWLTGWL